MSLPTGTGTRPHSHPFYSQAVPPCLLCPGCLPSPEPLPWDSWSPQAPHGGSTWLATYAPSPGCWCSPLSLYGERAPFLFCFLPFSRTPSLSYLRCYGWPLPPSHSLSRSSLSPSPHLISMEAQPGHPLQWICSNHHNYMCINYMSS